MLNDFDYEAYQKGIIARGSKNKNRKYKNWPAAHMSARELQKRNGETVEFNMNQPMNWEVFKKVCQQSQRDYVLHLIELYNATMGDFADMFGVTRNTIMRHFSQTGLTQYFAKGRRMNTQQRKVWEKFLSSASDTDSDTEPAEISEEIEIETADTAVPVQEPAAVPLDENCMFESKPVPSPAENTTMTVGAFTLEFSGTLDPQTLVEKLKAILPENAVGNLRIVCNLKSDNSSNSGLYMI
ncbi:MAG: hypothetical protein IIU58_03230 [Clostridia bacterium]|nr:hypothetical protein [Clostridia bacterium]